METIDVFATSAPTLVATAIIPEIRPPVHAGRAVFLCFFIEITPLQIWEQHPCKSGNNTPTNLGTTPLQIWEQGQNLKTLFPDFTNARKPPPRLGFRAFFTPQKNIWEHGTHRGGCRSPPLCVPPPCLARHPDTAFFDMPCRVTITPVIALLSQFKFSLQLC